MNPEKHSQDGIIRHDGAAISGTQCERIFDAQKTVAHSCQARIDVRGGQAHFARPDFEDAPRSAHQGIHAKVWRKVSLRHVECARRGHGDFAVYAGQVVGVGIGSNVPDQCRSASSAGQVPAAEGQGADGVAEIVQIQQARTVYGDGDAGVDLIGALFPHDIGAVAAKVVADGERAVDDSRRGDGLAQLQNARIDDGISTVSIDAAARVNEGSRLALGQPTRSSNGAAVGKCAAEDIDEHISVEGDWAGPTGGA